eukprot:scaffold585_cov330-Pavlova_lutheri.AAC.13
MGSKSSPAWNSQEQFHQWVGEISKQKRGCRHDNSSRCNARGTNSCPAKGMLGARMMTMECVHLERFALLVQR